MVTSWSWPSSTASLVCAMNAATSLATNISPSPTPITSGELRRAATSSPGTSACTATRVNAPSSRRQTAAIAAGRSPLPRSYSAASRCATTSVSVSLASSIPARSSSARSGAKFSMMPLWMTATRPRVSRCGWALRSVGPPWVAHRVCPMPVVPGSFRSCSAMLFSRLISWPALRATPSEPSGAWIATPGRVVPAVLHPAQTVQHQRQRLLRTDISDDSAHADRG